MKKLVVILMITVLALASVFAVDFSKNRVTFTFTPFAVDWEVPVTPVEGINETEMSKFGLAGAASFLFSHTEEFGLELSAKFAGYHFENFYYPVDKGGINKYVLGLMAKEVITVPLSERVAFMAKLGAGANMTVAQTTRNWHFAFGVDADATYAFDDKLSFVGGVAFEMDFSHKSTKSFGACTSRYLSVQAGVISYL